jgi:serine/threonine protein kinase
MLYEMLTGQRPFTGDAKLSILAAIVNQEPRPAGQQVEGLPSELDRVLAQCLRKDPARRFQTMADRRLPWKN